MFRRKANGVSMLCNSFVLGKCVLRVGSAGTLSCRHCRHLQRVDIVDMFDVPARLRRKTGCLEMVSVKITVITYGQ